MPGGLLSPDCDVVPIHAPEGTHYEATRLVATPPEGRRHGDQTRRGAP